MQAKEAEQRFKQAEDLFQSGQYTKPLDILNELNGLFPGQRNVLISMALCLEKLGRWEEALQACRYLIKAHDDAQAKEIEQRVTAVIQKSPAQTPVAQEKKCPIKAVEEKEINLEKAPFRPPTPVPEDRPHHTDYKWPIIIGLIIALFAISLILLRHGGTGAAPSDPAQAIPLEVWTFSIGFMLMILMVMLVTSLIGSYVGLRLQDKLLYDDLGPDVLDVGLLTLFIDVISFTGVGVFVGGYIAARHWDMNLSELMVWALTMGSICLASTSVFMLFLL